MVAIPPKIMSQNQWDIRFHLATDGTVTMRVFEQEKIVHEVVVPRPVDAKIAYMLGTVVGVCLMAAGEVETRTREEGG